MSNFKIGLGKKQAKCILMRKRWVFDVVMSQIQAMAEDAQPLLSEFRDSGLLKEVECLTRSLTQASNDLR